MSEDEVNQSEKPASTEIAATEGWAEAIAADFVRSALFESVVKDEPEFFATLPFRFCGVERVDAGGQGVVYKAWDESFHRPVALKRYLSNAAGMAPRELSYPAMLKNRNHLVSYELLEEFSSPVLVMDWVGPSLAKKCSGRRAFGARQAATWLAPIAGLIGELAQKDGMHGDIKPGNILISEDDPNIAKLTDFGLAARIPLRNDDRSFCGTFAYAAPEQFKLDEKQFSPATEVFSLGIILWEVAFGGHPFELKSQDDLETCRVAITQRTPSFDKLGENPVSPRFLAICMKSLAKDPRDRFADGFELQRALEDYLDSETSFVVDFQQCLGLLREQAGSKEGTSGQSLGQLVHAYAKTHPGWKDGDELIAMEPLFELLLRQRRSPVATRLIDKVSDEAADRIREIRDVLKRPDQCLRMASAAVVSVALDDPLSKVARMIRDRRFSQFPIYEKGRFKGLITEKTLARALADRVGLANQPHANMNELTVRDAFYSPLPQEEPSVCRFIPESMFVDEVIRLFRQEIGLEACLVTKNGVDSEEPLGIITVDDVLRYSSSRNISPGISS